MKVQQFVIKDSTGSDAALAAIKGMNPDVLFTFADVEFFRTSQFSERLAAAAPAATSIGCSTAGEISSKGVTTGCAVVTALKLDHPGLITRVEALRDMSDSESAGARLGAQLRDLNPHSVLVFGQGVELNGSALIRGLRSVLGSGVTISGGLAGDAGRFERTYVLTPTGPSVQHVVGIALCSPKLQVRHGTFGGWRPFGAVRYVTRAEGNLLFELDGEPALDVYKRYLGHHAKDLPGSALLFPFAMLDTEQQETGVIRTILGVDEATGSLTMAGELVQGGFVRLMCASSDDLIDGAEVAAESIERDTLSDRESLALLVSCVGRRMVLGTRVDEEVEAVASILGARCTVAGFYSNGEISPGVENTECHLHNQTMTVTYLSEVA